MSSRRNGTIYVGATSNLVQRVAQHREGMIEGLARKYGCTKLVWFEAHDDLQEARARELRLKKWNRAWKLRLIEENNPEWHDLIETIF